MAVPDYQTLMLPLLRFTADHHEHTLGEAIDALAEDLGLTTADQEQLLASGTQTVLRNRAGWARTYLKKAGLLEYPRRGRFRITPRGEDVLKENPPRVDVKLLARFPEFLAFRNARREAFETDDEQGGAALDDPSTPEEALEVAYDRLRAGLEADVLDQVKAATPAFFERLVIDVLVAMGYGGNRRDAAQAVGRGGDGGIDGIIKEDRLGLDVIYIQAKRWEGTVSRPEVQKFAGALQGRRARKGVFITTSAFSRDAISFAEAIEAKIILIDGAQLAKLMIDHGVGVSTIGTYDVKKIDADYFTEE